jgi:hypothetical protein
MSIRKTRNRRLKRKVKSGGKKNYEKKMRMKLGLPAHEKPRAEAGVPRRKPPKKTFKRNIVNKREKKRKNKEKYYRNLRLNSGILVLILTLSGSYVDASNVQLEDQSTYEPTPSDVGNCTTGCTTTVPDGEILQQLQVFNPSSTASRVQPELVIACTGNTCRSASLATMMESRLKRKIKSCGTGRDGDAAQGSQMTYAAQVAQGNLIKDKKLNKRMSTHRSTACLPPLTVKDTSRVLEAPDNKIFGVVAQQNKDDLLELAKERGIKIRDDQIFVLPCNLQDDPWYYTKAGVTEYNDNIPSNEPERIWTQESQDRAYQELAVEVSKCTNDISPLFDMVSNTGSLSEAIESIETYTQEQDSRNWQEISDEREGTVSELPISNMDMSKSLPGKEPSIGIDLGGVLNQHNNDVKGDTTNWHLSTTSEAPGAMDGVKELVNRFGAENVHVVSKLTVGSAMETNSKTWLFKTMDICRRTGMLRKNVHFVNDISGPLGKGVIAQKLGLSHFIDDKGGALDAVASDREGNSIESINKHDGQLFHFARSGNKKNDTPKEKKITNGPSVITTTPVENWDDLLENLNVPVVKASPRSPLRSKKRTKKRKKTRKKKRKNTRRR